MKNTQKSFKSFKNRLRPFGSFYMLAGSAFMVWVTFFDSNNLINQYRLGEKHEGLQGQKAYYEREIKQLENSIRELSSDPDELEKFAREKYLFKKRGEDIYIMD